MLVKAKSKLYLAGEYAVLRANSYAIIAAIDKYTYLEIEKSSKEEVISEIEDRESLLYNARAVAFTYANKYEKLKYIYKSDLYEDGKKYGLGSSASVVVVTIKAILSYFNIKYSKRTLFDLSVKALKQAKQEGSMGDVAAICFEGLILYQNKTYAIKKINPKKALLINAYWTKKEASTKKQIKNISKIYNTKEFNTFCDKSDKYCLEMYEAIKNADEKLLVKSIKNLRENLKEIENLLSIEIYSEEVKKLITNDNYKTSGAGKGDFVISLSMEDGNEEKSAYRVCFRM